MRASEQAVGLGKVQGGEGREAGEEMTGGGGNERGGNERGAAPTSYFSRCRRARGAGVADGRREGAGG